MAMMTITAPSVRCVKMRCSFQWSLMRTRESTRCSVWKSLGGYGRCRFGALARGAKAAEDADHERPDQAAGEGVHPARRRGQGMAAPAIDHPQQKLINHQRRKYKQR